MLNKVKNVISSPFAGLYWFVLLFLLATMTGELDPLHFLYNKAFPEEDSFGQASLGLSPLPGLALNPTPLASSSSSSASLHGAKLLLLRHNKGISDQVKLLRRGGNPSIPALAIGSINGTAVPRQPSRLVFEPLNLIDVDLPPKALLAVTSTVDPNRQAAQPDIYFLTNGTVEKEFGRSSDLIVLTRNEVRSTRVLYILSIVSAGLVGLSLPKFRTLKTVEEGSILSSVAVDAD